MRVWLRSSLTPLACSWPGTRNRPSTPATPPPAVGPGVRPADRAAAVPRNSRSDPLSKIAGRANSTIDAAGRRRIAIAIADRLRTVGHTRTGRRIRIGHPATSTIAMHRPAAARATTIATSSHGADRRAGRPGLIRARGVAVGHPAGVAASARGARHREAAKFSSQRRRRAVSTAATASTTTPSASSAVTPRGRTRTWPGFTSPAAN
jgi:hypothetical protein